MQGTVSWFEICFRASCISIPSGIRSSSFNKKLFGIPIEAIQDLLFYRQDIFQKHNIKPPVNFEELFSACKTEFKNLEYFYFHNYIYETVWKDNRRRHNERIKTDEVIHKYASDYKIIFVGDATMAPYEITNPGGSIEHWNEEAGSVWMKKIMTTYDKLIWLNPVPEEHWDYSSSIEISRHLIDDNMFPLTLKGLEDGMSFLSKK